MVYELLCVAMVIECDTGREFQKTSAVQREAKVCFVCVRVVIKNVLIL